MNNNTFGFAKFMQIDEEAFVIEITTKDGKTFTLDDTWETFQAVNEMTDNINILLNMGIIMQFPDTFEVR